MTKLRTAQDGPLRDKLEQILKERLNTAEGCPDWQWDAPFRASVRLGLQGNSLVCHTCSRGTSRDVHLNTVGMCEKCWQQPRRVSFGFKEVHRYDSTQPIVREPQDDTSENDNAQCRICEKRYYSASRKTHVCPNCRNATCSQAPASTSREPASTSAIWEQRIFTSNVAKYQVGQQVTGMRKGLLTTGHIVKIIPDVPGATTGSGFIIMGLGTTRRCGSRDEPQ